MATATTEKQRPEKTYEEKLADAQFYAEASNKFEKQVMIPAIIVTLIVIITAILHQI